MSYIGRSNDEWEWQQLKKKKKAALKNSRPCPYCGKRFSKEGKSLKHHIKDVHNIDKVPNTLVIDGHPFIVLGVDSNSEPGDYTIQLRKAY